jgi:hypothetical protein
MNLHCLFIDVGGLHRIRMLIVFHAFHKLCFGAKVTAHRWWAVSGHQKHAIKFKNLDCLFHVSYTLLWFTNKAHKWWVVSIKNNAKYWFGVLCGYDQG